MLTNIKGSEAFGILAAINPSAQAAGTATSGWVSAATAHKLLAIVAIGALGASATVDAKIQQATDSSGSGAKDITGAAIVQHTTGNNKQQLINVDAAQLDVEGGFSYVQLSITVATAATGTAGLLVNTAPRYEPATQSASVTQTIG